MNAHTLDELLKKARFWHQGGGGVGEGGVGGGGVGGVSVGVPSQGEMNLIQDLLIELKKYREGGVTEEVLRRNDGAIKVGRGCIIALDIPRDT